MLSLLSCFALAAVGRGRSNAGTTSSGGAPGVGLEVLEDPATDTSVDLAGVLEGTAGVD